ncbi:SDR family NAD(P)-dependent oxidoreductase [Bilophila wadsworthia]|uniref:SDR family NAD(P)-dependent oxidoreductase n=1 Tax=Bilophila wadsworthia TaxID=35833 RepID=UPI00399CE923
MLVLGATSGIARATARAFAGSGWTLQLAGRDIQRLQKVADDCGGASIFPFDALDPASSSALWGLLPS